ncbi:MAG: FAD binding domain-containing protein [Treponema sp.]|jgi:CO/xanthine dehydrogenase FAD-binding subunit|nr:FAD binding domain-containing protein [Treponema sp.]
MDAVNPVSVNQVFSPSTYTELFGAWERFPAAALYAGGSALLHNQGGIVPRLPQTIITLDKIEDLRRISRTERYLEVGAAVTLNEILALGKVTPDILVRCIDSLIAPPLWNVVTLGGGLCIDGGLPADLAVPLAALESLYELRGQGGVRWVAASRFAGLSPDAPRELLTRVRIPIEQWDYSLAAKLAPAGAAAPGGLAVFLARAQKDTLVDLRILYGCKSIIRDKNSESELTGKHLPLDRRDTFQFQARWKAFLSGLDNALFGASVSEGAFAKARLLAFIAGGVESLT